MASVVRATALLRQSTALSRCRACCRAASYNARVPRAAAAALRPAPSPSDDPRARPPHVQTAAPSLQPRASRQSAPAGSWEERLLQAYGAAPLLAVYRASRAPHVSLDEPRTLALCALTLTRIAATSRATSSNDAAALESPAMRALIQDVHRHALRAASARTRTHTHTHTHMDTATLSCMCAMMHACTKLRALLHAAVPSSALTRDVSEAFARLCDAAVPALTHAHTRGAAMAVWACARERHRLADAVRELAKMRAKSSAWAARFQPAECAMLATALSTATDADAGVPKDLVHKLLDDIIVASVPQLARCNQATLVSMMWAFTTARHAHPGLLAALAAEMTARVDMWTGTSEIAPSSNDKERATPFSPRGLATVLYCFGVFASHGRSAGRSVADEPWRRNVTAMFRACARYLTSISAESSTDDGGQHGFRDAAAATPVAAGDVAVISTYDGEAIASIVWAASRWHDELSYARQSRASRDATEREAVDRLWAAVQASAAFRVNRACLALTGSTSIAPQALRDFRSNHQATVAWALTNASVPAPQYLDAALRHAATATVSYSVAAVAQLLWSATVQGVYHDAAFDACFEHVLRTADTQQWLTRRQDRSARSPDVVAAALRPDAPPDLATPSASTSKLQAQLYFSYVAWRLERNVPGPPVPGEILSHWRGAHLQAAPRSSELAATVSAVLRSAAIEHRVEHILADLLVVDVFVPSLNLVIEVNGPTHYVGGETLRDVPATANPFSAAAMRLGRDANDVDDVVRHRASSEDPLVPTLRTRAKRRLIHKCGYKLVTVNWREWDDAPSTQERLELLADKGVPIKLSLLSRAPLVPASTS